MPADLIQFPDSRLRMPSSSVGDDGGAIATWVEALIEALDGLRPPQARFCALSGVQVGIMKRLCVLWTREGGYRVLVNPSIEETGGDSKCYYEGCFSIPGYRFPVARPTWALIKWDNEFGEHLHERFEDLHARLVLHEIDHMDGVLCSDRAIGNAQILTGEEYRSLLARGPEWAGLKSNLARGDFDVLQKRILELHQEPPDAQ